MGYRMEKFWELLKQSIIVQSTLTLLLASTICALFLMGKDVPDVLLSAFFVVLGYYFRHKRDLEDKNARTNFEQ